MSEYDRKDDVKIDYLIGKFEMFESKVEDKLDHMSEKVEVNSKKLSDLNKRMDGIEDKFSMWATTVKTVKFIGILLFFLVSLNFEQVVRLLTKG